MSKLNVGTLRPTEAFTVPLQSTSTRNNTDHQVGSIIYNTDTNSAQVLTANNGWLNMGKGKVSASGGTELHQVMDTNIMHIHKQVILIPSLLIQLDLEQLSNF